MKAEQEHFDYLAKLRDSGVVNMFGSPAYLARRFGISWNDASKIVGEWVTSFHEPAPK